jgi:hypothetical protein
MPRERSGRATVTIDLRPEIMDWLTELGRRVDLTRSGAARLVINEAYAKAVDEARGS